MEDASSELPKNDAVFAPPTIGVIVGFVIGSIAPMPRLIIGATTPLHLIQDFASLVGTRHDPSYDGDCGSQPLKRQANITGIEKAQ
ncbi:auxin efflux carrier [Artemisia annua]|uniref:Auxin efflux carrier n=1 Tax=Artemisia annua TaxID=35608 RepID=A0A2U1KTB3_ARTAN|nr:auxin efflux carrier [Artemisia annua]